MEDTVRTNHYVKQHNSSSILLEPHELVVTTEILFFRITTEPDSSTIRATFEKFWFASVIETRLLVSTIIGTISFHGYYMPILGYIKPIFYINKIPRPS